MTECADGTPEETPHDGDDDPDPAAQGSTGAGTDIVDEQLAAQLVAQARAQGISLVGPDGLLQRMTKLVVEGALEGELTDHLGYQHGDPVGRNGGNSRNGTRAKTVLTEVGPVELEVPRDRDASFQPQIVRKRQRRLGGVEDLVVSLVAKGLTTGEVQAHLAEIYGAEVSRQTISVITDRVLEGLAEWQNRPLDPVYPVIFIDAINVKLRDGQVANRPIYVALAVTADGERDILGLWAGDGGEGAKLLAARAYRDQQPRRGRCVHRGLRPPAGPPRRPQRGVAGRGDPPRCVVHLLPKQLPLRLPSGLGPDRHRPQARLHRSDRDRRAGGAGQLRRGLEARYPAIIRLWEHAWAEFVPFLAFDAEIRTVIATTNAIESLNARFRRSVKARGNFPNEQAALKHLYLTVVSLDPTGRGRRRWTNRWKAALNAFDIAFDGRVSAGRK